MHGLIEEHARRPLQEAVLEFEVDLEMNITAAIYIREGPDALQVFERAVDILGFNLSKIGPKARRGCRTFRETP